MILTNVPQAQSPHQRTYNIYHTSLHRRGVTTWPKTRWPEENDTADILGIDRIDKLCVDSLEIVPLDRNVKGPVADLNM